MIAEAVTPEADIFTENTFILTAQKSQARNQIFSGLHDHENHGREMYAIERDGIAYSPLTVGAAATESRRIDFQPHRRAAWMAKYYCDPALQTADFAKANGLHPNYAMSLFRRHSGIGIVDCLQQHRTFRARFLFSTTHEKIISNTLENGFGSFSRFYEVFQAHCGCTPQKFRMEAKEKAGQVARS